jgi:PAS domain S-box-containing protein
MSNRFSAADLVVGQVAAERPEQPFTAAFQKARAPMLIADARAADNPILFVNDAFLELTGYTREEIVGRNCRFLQGPGTDQAVVSRIAAAIAAGERIETEIFNYRKDGTPFWNALLISPVRDGTGRLLYFVGSQADIGERKEAAARFAAAEERLERVASELQSALDRKTALLHEVDHRVKNNLQVIASLVHLQSRCLQDESAERALSDLAERIGALATVHRLLNPSGDAGRFDLAAFIRELLEELGSAPGAKQIRIELDLEPVTVSASQASALGLLVNEIASHATKCGFPDGRDGRLQVAVRGSGSNIAIVFTDDGIALADRDFNETGFGPTLIRMMTRQLKAEIAWADAQPGTCVTVTLPLSRPDEEAGSIPSRSPSADRAPRAPRGA